MANIVHTVLLSLLTIGVLAIIAISIATVVKVYQDDEETTPAPTPQVVYQHYNEPVDEYSPLAKPYAEVATLFRSMVNSTIDPCDDFYAFTCANINRSLSFEYLDYINYQTMANQISDAQYRASNLPLPVKQLFNYHNVCKQALQDWSSITKDGAYVKSKLRQFQDSTGLNFPLLTQTSGDPAMPNKTTFAKAIGFLQGSFGLDTFISTLIDTDWKNPNAGYMFFIDQSSLVYSDSYYVKAWALIRDSYKNRTMQYMNALQSGLDQQKLSADVDDILNLEYTIATKISETSDARRKYARQYNIYTASQASDEFDFLDWSVFLEQSSVHAEPAVQQMMLRSDFEFSICEPAALANLGQYLKANFSARTIVNYLNFRVVYNFRSYIPTKERASAKNKILDEIVIEKPRVGLPRHIRRRRSRDISDSVDVSCAAETMSAMQYANARVFIDAKYPTPESRVSVKDNVSKVIEGILIAFRSMVDQLNWMSEASKEGAYSKIDNLVRNIAFPDFVTDDTLLTQYYESLNISADQSYTDMQENILKFNMRSAYSYLIKNSAIRDDFNGPPGTVNAWYQPEVNSITFPAAILQQPFYDPAWPASVVYGAIGVVAGHELTHGFDDQGVQWDGTGVLYQWMDNNTYSSFQDMANCVINEYAGFCPLDESFRPSNCLDGSMTQGENIADNGGIQAAYRAYSNLVDLNGPDPLLNDPVMSYFTHDQLFFMGFAQVWCEQTPTDEEYLSQILVDPHSPPLYRVFGTIQNYPAFRAAFNCPEGSRYSPRDHCDVWVSDIEGSHGVPEPKKSNPLNLPSPPPVSSSNKTVYKAYSQAASFFSYSMNLSADPCNDFYEYACGNYLKPKSFTAMREENYRQMAVQMEDPMYDAETTPRSLKETIKFYKKCKEARANFTETIKDGAVLKGIMQDFASRMGWVFSMVYNQTHPPSQALDGALLGKAVGLLSFKGVHTIVTPMVDTDWVRPSVGGYKFFVDQSTLYYSNSYYSTQAWATIVNNHKNNTMQLFRFFAALEGVTLNETLLSNDVDSLFDFELTLARNYSTDDTTRRTYLRSYNPYRLANASFPFLNFTAYLSALSATYPALNNYFNDASTVFFVMEKDMLTKLSNDWGQKFNSNTVINYLFYRLLAANSEYLPKPADYREIPVEFKEDEIGMRGRPRRIPKPSIVADATQQQCAYETLKNMQYANGRLYIDHLYPNADTQASIQESVGEIMRNIIAAFQGMLKSLTWMDDESKNAAMAKTENIVQNIAFPPWIVNNSQLDQYYSGMQFSETDSYFDMLDKLNQFNFELSYKVLLNGTPVDRSDFLGPPGTVNAWYQPEANSITFPAGILMQPFFDLNWPVSLNYGGLGVVAGHELTHGFDDQGVQWDGIGALTNWMTENSMAGFNEMAQCVIDEYNGFCPLNGTGMKPDCLNGENTQGENIADNGGIHAAWNAYSNYVALHGPDPMLPDPVIGQFTHDQLFFLGFAQVWCQKDATNDEIYTQIMTDPHSPSKYRVFGTVRNFPAFRAAFNCPKGSVYAPEEYCSVWVPDVNK